MKGTPRKVRKFADGGYTGNDEIVQYRMGQIKDPGVDLFKLVRGEEQVAKPVPLDKKPETKAGVKTEETAEVTPVKEDSKTYSYPDSSLVKEPPIIGGKTKAPVKTSAPVNKKPVIKEETTTTVVTPAKSSSAIDTDDPEYRKKPFLERLKLESGAAYNDAKNKIKNTTAEDLASTALGMFPAFRGIKALAAGKNAFDKARDVTPKPDQIGMDARRIGMDPRKIGMNPRKQLELDRSGQSNRASSSGGMKGEFNPKDLRSDFKKGGKIKKMASGGKVSSASKRADGCAIRGKTRA